MATINLVKAGTAVGVGIVDEVLERYDETSGRVGFTRWSSLARIAGVAGGYALVALGPRSTQEMGETVAIAATPLLVKELSHMLMKSPVTKAYFAPRMVATGGQVQDYAPATPGRSQYRPLQ